MIVAQPSILAPLSIVRSSSLQQASPSLALLPLETLGEAARPCAQRLSVFFRARLNHHPFIILRTLARSCCTFSNVRPLFSTASTLFCKNTRGGGTQQTCPVYSATYRLFFPHLVATQLLARAMPGLCLSRPTDLPSKNYSLVFTMIQNPLPATPLYSHRYKT
jgi:hypothetical protein